MSKYRLWDKQDKKMIMPSDVQDSKNLLAIGLHGLPIAVDRDSFRDGGIMGWNVDHRYVSMQFASRKDRRGTEIYAGDIVRVWIQSHSGPMEVRESWIVWNDARGMWQLENGLATLDIDKTVALEIIGNRYEHPDLLPKKEQHNP
jgi:hypothetical protein